MIQPLFLIGVRGSGKTTVGRRLAKALGYDFVDTDSQLLASSGKTVTEIVEAEGWPGFRRRESSALKEVTAPTTVVATGGGAVLAEENRQWMTERGVVIWLNVPIDVLAQRLDAAPESEQRPALTEKSMRDEIVAILAEREALYRQAADIIVEASDPPEQIVTTLLAALQQLTVNQL